MTAFLRNLREDLIDLRASYDNDLINFDDD